MQRRLSLALAEVVAAFPLGSALAPASEGGHAPGAKPAAAVERKALLTAVRNGARASAGGGTIASIARPSSSTFTTAMVRDAVDCGMFSSRPAAEKLPSTRERN
jgi:hypothetical protein